MEASVLADRLSPAAILENVDAARFELHCAACGYGVVVRAAPDRCPMCGGSSWRDPARVGWTLARPL